mmetsp:Transcript_59641/g.134361  ORF Transcript_59641/g.134361 Transcript_59641/m.134361 type:complete len:145 (+) Transcript_59641:61-495(+)
MPMSIPRRQQRAGAPAAAVRGALLAACALLLVRSCPAFLPGAPGAALTAARTAAPAAGVFSALLGPLAASAIEDGFEDYNRAKFVPPPKAVEVAASSGGADNSAPFVFVLVFFVVILSVPATIGVFSKKDPNQKDREDPNQQYR